MFPYKIEKSEHFHEAFADVMASLPTPSCLVELTEEPYASAMASIDSYLRISASRFGSVYGFAQEQDGLTVQNLFPIQTNEDKQISSSSKTVLEMHTETAFHPWRPEVVMLFCVRGDSHAGTNLATLADIIEHLDDETIRLLHLPEFITKIDESFQSETQPDREILTPVLFDGATSITYDRALMRGLNASAQNALDLLSSAIEKVKTTVFLNTGELLILNNRVCIHGRTPFPARYDGTDRWIKRAMVSTRLPNWDEMEIRSGRYKVVTTRF